ncbi:MAG: hypothetical protein V2I33_20750, partial [Kangiellaceae bacterium]|nr:hypothetical protein [Kangiellaceae bacterium]
MKDALRNGISNEITAMLIGSRGEQKTSGNVQLYVYNEEAAGCYTYGAYNDTNRTVTASFDCTRSQGMLFSTQKPTATIEIEPERFGF